MKDDSFNQVKVSYFLNIIIFIFVVVAFIIMFTGIKFTFGIEPVLETTKLGVFKFFTVDSNLLIGISALLLSYKERELFLGKIKKIPSWYYVFKFVATVSVSLTMVVVFTYLGRIASGGLISLLQNSNLFFHFVIPLLSLITFVFFERTKKIKFGYVIFCLIPVILYGIYYVINVIVHMENGEIVKKYDWYAFAQIGIDKIYITAIIILLLTYILGLLIWIINRKQVLR